MRAVSVACALALLSSAAFAMPSSLRDLKCPVSNKANTGCYCTHGCSINGDTGFPWNAPVFPPTKYSASFVGSDTICAKIVIPTTAGAAAVNLTAYLGTSGQVARTGAPYNGVATNSQVTVWTAFTQDECEKFVVRVKNLVAETPAAGALITELCTTEACNGVNVPPVPAPVLSEASSQLPGVCPVANPSNTGCYCTNGCSINGDVTSFLWKPNSWPPAAIPAAVVGSDTICAKITVPALDTAEGRALTAYLGITGDINRTGTSNYFGAAPSQTVTVYTAFTAAECANFIRTAANLTSKLNINTSVQLCNTDNCNKVEEPRESYGFCPARPSVDPYGSPSCAGTTTCSNVLCACVGGTVGSNCRPAASTTCPTFRLCLAAYSKCLNDLASARLNASDPCNSFGTIMHNAQLAAAASSYAGSSLQQSCGHAMCSMLNGSTPGQTCVFGQNYSTVCMSPDATSAPTSAPAIVVRLRLGGNDWGLILNDPVKKAQLTAAILADLATILGIAASFITIVAFSIGSLIIDFSVGAGSGKTLEQLAAGVQTAGASSTWITSVKSVYATVSTETLTVLGTSVTATPTTASPVTTQAPSPTSSAATVSIALIAAVIAAMIAIVA